MRCGSGFDEGAAAGVGELVGGVDATCGNSHTLGGFDEPCVGPNQGDRAPWGRGGPGPDPLQLDAHNVVGTVVVR